MSYKRAVINTGDLRRAICEAIEELPGKITQTQACFVMDAVLKIVDKIEQKQDEINQEIRNNRTMNSQSKKYDEWRDDIKKLELPKVEWDRFPLVMKKRDLFILFDGLPESFVRKHIQIGTLKERKNIGIHPYFLTEEVKEAYPIMYNELKFGKELEGKNSADSKQDSKEG
jgi:hypothetical protein